MSNKNLNIFDKIATNDKNEDIEELIKHIIMKKLGQTISCFKNSNLRNIFTLNLSILHRPLPIACGSSL